jgi:hypothetical protein
MQTTLLIFSEKPILEKGRVANTPYSNGVLVMFNIVNAIQGSEKKKDVISDVLSTNALPPGLVPKLRDRDPLTNDIFELYHPLLFCHRSDSE